MGETGGDSNRSMSLEAFLHGHFFLYAATWFDKEQPQEALGQ